MVAGLSLGGASLLGGDSPPPPGQSRDDAAASYSAVPATDRELLLHAVWRLDSLERRFGETQRPRTVEVVGGLLGSSLVGGAGVVAALRRKGSNQ